MVGSGSTVAAGSYTASAAPIAPAPQWLVDRLGVATRPDSAVAPGNAAAGDTQAAIDRATRYLLHDAPVAVEGSGGDATTFRVACRLKDFGISQATAADLLIGTYNSRCSPPWDAQGLIAKVAHAYRYGFEPPGVADPAAAFKPVAENPAPVLRTDAEISPYEKLNKEYAYTLAGGGDTVLWETADEHDRFLLVRLAVNTFHRKHAADTVAFGNKTVPVTEEWIRWKGRRSYDGVVFIPGREAPARFYNLWRGFAVEPLAPGETPTPDAQAALDAFLDHALNNVCHGDKKLFQWLIGYFAHMVQKPWEKPLTALAFKGGKGVGKNALVERIGHLFGNHFLVAARKRYLTSNFNGHLENLIFMALDEASWAGDKDVEGVLKDLITGAQHVIEHKGEKPYTVDNRTRIAIIGNEEWIVPASHDERRFAVFDVGDGRKQDRAFFQTMRERMEAGGDRLLLRFLLEYELAGLDVNAAPATRALLDQKTASLEPVPQWWMACLLEGRIAGGDFEGWPGETDCERIRGAFRRYARERNVKSRLPDECRFGREMKKLCPAMGHTRKGAGYVYQVPALEKARAQWDAYMGYGEEWPE